MRNSLPYRLTFQFVVILRLHRREFTTGSRSHLTVRPRSRHIGLYACTAAAHREIGIASGTRKRAFETGPRGPIGPALPARARIVQRTNRVGSRKYSPRAQRVLSSRCRQMSGTRGIGYQSLPKTLTSLKKCGTATGSGMAPEKSHRNCRGIKKPNAFRYLYAEGIWLCPVDIPRKTSPFDGNPSYDNRM